MQGAVTYPACLHLHLLLLVATEQGLRLPGQVLEETGLGLGPDVHFAYAVNSVFPSGAHYGERPYSPQAHVGSSPGYRSLRLAVLLTDAGGAAAGH